jgi:hypothetical protein
VQRVNHFLLSCLVAWLPLLLTAQEVAVTVTPINTSIKVGIPFKVELSVRHPQDMVVVFPDSAKDFAPYELVKSNPRATKTDAGFSVDATILELISWEIDSMQALQFNIGYLDAKGDTIRVPSNKTELTFLPVLTAYSDSLKLKLHEKILPIIEPINFVAWAIILFGLAAFLVILFVLLRKPATRTLRRWAVKRDWDRFRREYEGVLPLLPQQENYATALSMTWKRYLDRRNAHRLNAMTTSELAEALEQIPILNEEDITALTDLGRSRDMILFAGVPESEERLRSYHQRIGAVMEKEYQRRKEAAEA